MLACHPKREAFAELVAGFGVHALSGRYVTRTVATLAARAPEAGPGAAGRQEGRARLPGHRQHHLNLHRLGRRRAVVSTPAGTVGMG